MTAGLRAHWLFCVLLAAGAVLRVLAQVGFEPTLFFFDSFTYLEDALHWGPDTPRPLGYSVLVVRPLLLLHNLAVIPLVQHLCGLGVGVLVYAVLIRRGARPWVASLGAAPVLLDGYQVQIEQMIASDAVFVTMVAAALGLLLWRRQPTPSMVMAAGLLLGLSATVRFVGGPTIAVACLYLLFTSSGRKRLLNVGALAATAAVPLLVYSAWTFQHTGEFRPGGDSMSARTLYARVAPLADCAAVAAEGVPEYEMQLCPDRPPGRRSDGPMTWMYLTRPANFDPRGLPPGVDRYDLLRDFATRVLANQPLDVAVAVLDDFTNVFAWDRYQPPDSWPMHVWRFPTTVRPMGAQRFDESVVIEQFGGPPQTVDPGIATVLRGYQDVAYTRGPVFAVAIAVALWAGLRARRSGLRAAPLLVAGTGLALLGSAALYSFSWRYQIPAITLLPWALALGATALWPWARRRPAEVAAKGAHAAVVADDAAVADFRARHGEVALAPVVVVVAAYNEADSVGGVLQRLPAQVLGLEVDVVVVDDGSSDGTGRIAQQAGARVARLDRRRGQGAALRVGYRIAREGGASYIVTTDADGQYDAGEMPELLRPLVEDEADFVSGSRVLGRAETTDRVRSLGVRFFAAVISLATGARISDPANGFRAMRAELTGAVTLSQPQYQAAELLIAALLQGFRVTERPTTMRQREAGTTKKGGNLAYSIRFAGVVLGTWRRERRLRRAGRAPVIAEQEGSAAVR